MKPIQLLKNSIRFKFILSETKFSDNCLNSVLYSLHIEDLLDSDKIRYIQNFDKQYLLDYANEIFIKYEKSKRLLPKNLPYFYRELVGQLDLFQ
jgi:hypothetical protein